MADLMSQRVPFRFDNTRSFEANCDAFLDAVCVDDPEMATILRGNWGLLVAIVREGRRDYQVRGDFNAHVAAALDDLDAMATEPIGDP